MITNANAPEERQEWTSGFLDERLVEPVSPLGWSVLRPAIEEIAFREPLRMLGVDPSTLEPITRLWNGHPYASVAVFESLYKLFPDWLLPDDARRFFPNGETARRLRARRPRSILAPEVWIALFRSVGADLSTTLPFANVGRWVQFERRYEMACDDLAGQIDLLDLSTTPKPSTVVALLDEVETQNRELLRIHRWSLTHAEVSYSLLRRVATRLLGVHAAQLYCAEVVGRLGDRTIQMNRALDRLRRLYAAGRQPEFDRAFSDFLRSFGHRSFSLDLMRPGFAADQAQVMALIRQEPIADRSRDRTFSVTQLLQRYVVQPQAALLAPLTIMARRYARLREDQRFAWQRGLALLRRLYLVAGRILAMNGCLPTVDDVFLLNKDEVRRGLVNPGELAAGLVETRRREFGEARASFAHDSSASYPPFLLGSEPEGLVTSTALEGVPVSPGVGRGRARVILHPDDLASILPGEVLVTRGADPGWAVVFNRLAGLVTESGGQLSHAAVIAREYGLPAVLGVAGATTTIKTGDDVSVDGATGVVHQF